MFFIAPSITLVMLYLFVEKSLEDLCYSFTPGLEVHFLQVPGGEKFKINPRQSESAVGAFSRYLQEDCKFSLQVDEKLDVLMNDVRKLRNDFLHGDWENVRTSINSISIVEVAKIVSELFGTIEDASPISNLSSFPLSNTEP